MSLAAIRWPFKAGLAGNYMFGQIKPTSGEVLGEKHRGQKAVIVGEELARLKSVKVGNTLTISDEEVPRIVGVFKSEADLENSMIIMLLNDAQRTFGQAGRITGCTVTLKDKSPEGVEAAMQKIEDRKSHAAEQCRGQDSRRSSRVSLVKQAQQDCRWSGRMELALYSGPGFSTDKVILSKRASRVMTACASRTTDHVHGCTNGFSTSHSSISRARA